MSAVLEAAGVEFTNGDEPGVKLKATKPRGSEHPSEQCLVASPPDEVCSLYVDQALARQYGLSPAGIRRILIRNNIAHRPKRSPGES